MLLSSADEPHQAPTISSGDEPGPLPRDELTRRASAGVFIVATRGLAILLLGLGGNVVLAHLLTPRDFGVVAIGLSFVLFTAMLSDGGLGAGLIRRAEPPTTEELQALTAFQLVVTVTIALVVAAAAAPFGEIGWVIAVMVSSMPLVALQFPGMILLERSLSYRPLAVVEVSQVLVYHACAIGLVVAGLGVWGLATATVARAATAALIMARVSPAGLVRPRFSWRRIRSLIGFGARFQATTATWVIGDQVLNVSIAAIASVSTLGLWSLARRALEVPFLLFHSLWRVSYPAMSQLLAAKGDAAPVIERVLGLAAVGSGVVLTGLAGSAPGLIPGLFGEHWRAASGVIPWACLGLGIGGSVSVATSGYLYGVGDPSAVLRSVVFQTITCFAVALPLLPLIGVSAVGLGWFISAVVQAVVLGRATLKWTQVRLVRPLLVPVAVGVISAGIGWMVADLGGEDLWSGVAGGACSVVCFQVGLLILGRELLYETFRFVARSMRAAGSRGPATHAA
jgi:O-antigen/teichoic acid export membrane protein